MADCFCHDLPGREPGWGVVWRNAKTQVFMNDNEVYGWGRLNRNDMAQVVLIHNQRLPQHQWWPGLSWAGRKRR